ncbi:unnamed protein product [Medioppia subpectinata]|uniref:Ig-like domain-containing protein n=1 Tax=Medioppia subpectinata TaxID=1979941 RepID=A0A7R9KJ75_9ACAR|nr:unnamed protein product [Medioppia subpectinata]CAG2104399.1 unnamed protein product [Medioppia subpectinata]
MGTKPGNPIIRVNGHTIAHYHSQQQPPQPLQTQSNPFQAHQQTSTPKTSFPGINGYNYNKSDDNNNRQSAAGVGSGTPKAIDLLQQIGPFAESSTIVFECSSSGGRPLPEVRWYNGTRAMRAKFTVLTDGNDQDHGDALISNGGDLSTGGTGAGGAGPTVTATMRIIATRYDLGAKFECRVWNNATLVPLYQWIRLDIQVKPLQLTVRGPTQAVVAGEMVSLTCSVDGARPAANITWYNRSEVVAPHPLPSTDLMSDGTYRTSSTLVFIASRHDHLGDFFCKGSNQVLRSRNEVPLLQGTRLQVLCKYSIHSIITYLSTTLRRALNYPNAITIVYKLIGES